MKHYMRFSLIALMALVVLGLNQSFAQQNTIVFSNFSIDKDAEFGYAVVDKDNSKGDIYLINEDEKKIFLKENDTVFKLKPNKTYNLYQKDSIVSKWTALHAKGLFTKINSVPGPGMNEISWTLPYDTYDAIKEKYPEAKIILKWNTKIGADRHKKNYANSDWTSKEFPLNTQIVEIDDLAEHESYVFKLGLDNGESIIWTENQKFKTKRNFGVAKLLILLGSLAFFIYGMKIMSDGLQQAAGGRLKKMLGLMTGNRFTGILTGLGITSVVQSSSVTTVMTVSFVNAGLMTLRQSAGVMLGANIGTTITAWLILIVGFKVKIDDYAFMIMALASPLLFLKRGNSKAWLSTLFGFCILFIGLSSLKDAVPELSMDHPLVAFFNDYKTEWYGPVLFMLLGTIVTIIVQSSSAAMALTLTLVSQGIIPFDVACAMILGENIGTTITAELAALIANVHAKRAARVHFLFNVFGVFWALILLTPFKSMIESIVSFQSGMEFDANNKEMANTGIALFHTLFNLTNVLLLVWFIPQLVKIAEKMVKSRGNADEEFHLDYIGGGIVTSPDVSILEAKKEIAKFGRITSRMKGFVHTVLNTSNKKEKQKMFEKLLKYEEITDRVEEEITNYLSKASRLEMTDSASQKMRGMLNITTDLERIGDIFYQMGKTLEKKEMDKIWFSPEQRKQLNEMLALIEEAFDIMNENLNSEYGAIDLSIAIAKEKEINDKRDELRSAHHKRLESEEYNQKSGLIFTDLFSSLEKVGDHIINVSEAVSGEFSRVEI